MKFLFTGFDPFGENKINPASAAVEALPDKIGEHEIIKLLLPTSYTRAPQLLREAVEKYSPDVVICVGLAGGRKTITLELCALNVADSDTPDNDGFVKHMSKVIPASRANAHFTSVFVDRAAERLKSMGIPCQVSFHAGTYVCNTLYFHLLELCQQSQMQGLFVHIPFTPDQVEDRQGVYSLPLIFDVKALEFLVNFFTEI